MAHEACLAVQVYAGADGNFTLIQDDKHAMSRISTFLSSVQLDLTCVWTEAEGS